jgi:hypothetical protein
MAIPIIDLFPRNKYMAFGVLGCMASLIVEAALVANFVPSDNTNALNAAVAIFFIFQVRFVRLYHSAIMASLVLTYSRSFMVYVLMVRLQ